MSNLKWTDQDMIDFANTFSEYDIDDRHLSDFTEGRRREAIQRSINTLVGKAVKDEKLLEKLEKVLKESAK
jgi:hypothetical protein